MSCGHLSTHSWALRSCSWRGIPGDVNDQQKRYLGLIVHDAEHLNGLINDVLDLSKIEVGRLDLNRQPCDIAACITECVRGVQDRGQAKTITVEDRTALALTLEADRYV